MRTTVDLDQDLVALLQARGTERGMSLEQTLVDAAREHLAEHETSKPDAQYVFEPLPAGECRFENMDNIHEILAIVEGEDYR